MESWTLGKVKDKTKNKTLKEKYMAAFYGIGCRRWQREISERHRVVPDDLVRDWWLWMYGFV